MKRHIVLVMLIAGLTGVARAERIHPEIRLPSDPDAILFHYDPSNGDFRISQPVESTRGITTLEIISESSVFEDIPCPSVLCGGLFDIWGPDGNKLFKLDPEGFSELNLPGAMKTGLTLEFLANDLLVDGSMVGGGTLPEVVFPRARAMLFRSRNQRFHFSRARSPKTVDSRLAAAA